MSGTVPVATSTPVARISPTTTSSCKGKVKLIVDFNGDNIFSEDGSKDKVYEGVISENGTFSFVNVEVNKDGITKTKLVVEEDGYAPVEKIVELSDGSSINLKINPKLAEKVTKEVPPHTSRSGGYLVFALAKNTDGTTKAIVRTVTRADEIPFNGTEASITVPISNIPTNVRQITASLRLFRGNDTAQFPGEFKGVIERRDGEEEVQLKSIAYLYADFVDQNGTKVEFIEANETKADTCSNLLVRLRVPSDQVGNLEDADTSAEGYQVPVWRYNPSTGLWEYITDGTLKYSNGTEVSNNATNLDPSQNYYVEVCLPPGWTYCNLDYGVWMGEIPKEVKVCVNAVNTNDNPLSSVWVVAQGAENVGNTWVDAYTDASGSAVLTITVPSNATLDDIKNYYDFYYDYYNYGYYYTKIDENLLTESNNSECDYVLNLTLQNPFDAQVKIKAMDENNNPLANKWVGIWSEDSYYWNYKKTDANGEAVFDVKSGKLYYFSLLGQWGKVKVDGTTNYNETIDNGYMATVEVKKSNTPPLVDVYVYPNRVKQGSTTTAYLYAYDWDGDSLTLKDVKLEDNSILTSCKKLYSGNGYVDYQCEINTSNLDPTATLTATFSDGKVDANGTVTINIVSGNIPPVFYDLEIYDENGTYVNKDSLKPKTKYIFKIYGYDPDGVVTNYRVSIGKTDLECPAGVCEPYAFSTEGNYTLDINMLDNNGALGTYTSPVHVGNNPPQINSFAANKTNAEPGDLINLSAQISDDAELSSNNVKVTINGTENSTTLSNCTESFNDGKYYYSCNGQITLPSSTPADGYFVLNLTVTDAGGKSATDTLKIWTNRPPEINKALPSELKLEPGDTYTFEVSASDPEGKALSYKWYVNDNLQDDATGNSFTYIFENSGTYLVKVIVSDGQFNASSICNVTVTKPGSLEDVEAAFRTFLNDPTEDNYNKFLDAANSLSINEKEVHLWKAVATLLEIYQDNQNYFINDLNATFDNFETLTWRDVIYNLLNVATYSDDTQEVLTDLVNKLDTVDSELAQAEGINTSITLDDGQVVYFDDIDVKTMKAIAKLWKAACLYALAVNWEASNWTVNGTDIREMIKNGEEIPTELFKEFLDNNTNVFTYADTNKLSEFKDTFKAAVDEYKEVVDKLSKMTSDKLKQRYQNAFTFDCEGDVKRAEAIAKVFESYVNAGENPNADIISMDTIFYNSYKYVDGGDGYYYPARLFDIVMKYYKPAKEDLTIYNLLAGTKTLRDFFYEGINNDTYEPYIYDYNKIFATNLEDIHWSEPIETYNVTIAEITIDGNDTDWTNIPVFAEYNGISVKIARDSNNNFYMYVYANGDALGKEFLTDLGRFFLNQDGNWMNFGVKYDGQGDFTVVKCYKDSCNKVINYKKIISFGSDTVGIEVEFSEGYSELTPEGCGNFFDIFIPSESDSDGVFWKKIKLLPESSVCE